MSKQVFGKKEGREKAAQIEIKLLKSNTTLHMMHMDTNTFNGIGTARP